MYGSKANRADCFPPLQRGASAANSRAAVGSGWQAFWPLDIFLGPRNQRVGFDEVQRPKERGAKRARIEGLHSINQKLVFNRVRHSSLIGKQRLPSGSKKLEQEGGIQDVQGGAEARQ